jgi:hypothetical protein
VKGYITDPTRSAPGRIVARPTGPRHRCDSGVGQFAVQLAAVAGARVTAHVGSSDREDLARRPGADRLAPQGTAAHVRHSGRTRSTVLRDFAGGPLSKVVGFLQSYPRGPAERI